jgi:hypothetical protein
MIQFYYSQGFKEAWNYHQIMYVELDYQNGGPLNSTICYGKWAFSGYRNVCLLDATENVLYYVYWSTLNVKFKCFDVYKVVSLQQAILTNDLQQQITIVLGSKSIVMKLNIVANISTWLICTYY